MFPPSSVTGLKDQALDFPTPTPSPYQSTTRRTHLAPNALTESGLAYRDRALLPRYRTGEHQRNFYQHRTSARSQSTDNQDIRSAKPDRSRTGRPWRLRGRVRLHRCIEQTAPKLCSPHPLLFERHTLFVESLSKRGQVPNGAFIRTGHSICIRSRLHIPSSVEKTFQPN